MKHNVRGKDGKFVKVETHTSNVPINLTNKEWREVYEEAAAMSAPRGMVYVLSEPAKPKTMWQRISGIFRRSDG